MKKTFGTKNSEELQSCVQHIPADWSWTSTQNTQPVGTRWPTVWKPTGPNKACSHPACVHHWPGICCGQGQSWRDRADQCQRLCLANLPQDNCWPAHQSSWCNSRAIHCNDVTDFYSSAPEFWRLQLVTCSAPPACGGGMLIFKESYCLFYCCPPLFFSTSAL